MNFAKHGLYVTQRKDNEANAVSHHLPTLLAPLLSPASLADLCLLSSAQAHALNAYDCANPLVNFDNFFNGESLVQQDIVVWVNLGVSTTDYRSGQLSPLI